jgi:hypothetical protein
MITYVHEYRRGGVSKEMFERHVLKELYQASIFEFFSRTRHVNNLLSRFRKIGIYNLGDLVSYHEHELYRSVQASELARQRIRAALNECGLDFTGNKPPSLRPMIKDIDRKLGLRLHKG